MTDRLDALAAAATPGPWEWDDTSDQWIDFHDNPPKTGWFREGPGQVDVGEYLTLSAADAEFIVALVNAYRAGELVPVRERDELRAALDEAYPTTSRELFHGHHPMCGWTIEADPKACNCVVALHREDGA